MIRRILTLTQTLQTHNFMVKLGSFEAGYLGSEIREETLPKTDRESLAITESCLMLLNICCNCKCGVMSELTNFILSNIRYELL